MVKSHTLSKRPRSEHILKANVLDRMKYQLEGNCMFWIRQWDITKRQTPKYYINIHHMNRMIENGQIPEASPEMFILSQNLVWSFWNVIILSFKNQAAF